MTPAAAAKPGDLVEYRIVYDNKGSRPIRDLRVNGPVPAGTTAVESSAQSSVRSQLRFSHDGGVNWQAAPVRRWKAEGEGEVVPPSQYSNVQWIAQEPLSTGGSQRYSYRVRVTDAQPKP